MYVIRYTNDGTAGSVANTQPNGIRYFPADRCTWNQAQEAGSSNYVISGVYFYDGQSATGELLDGSVELGVIGKSGRFVGFTV